MGHLQRRDLQLPRASAGARRPAATPSRRTTDTEVIVHLYEELGPSCVDRLRGMFAFALWDAEPAAAADRARPARDQAALLRRGRRTALLRLRAEGAAGPSRRRAATGLVRARPSPDLPGHAAPAHSIVAGVKKLQPGHRCSCAPGSSPRVERYWDVRFEPDRGPSAAQLAERLAALIDESVRLHLVSDVPLGAFLSGGMDSSAVVAAMARLGGAPVKTFAIGFAEADYDELAYARQVARAFSTEHHELVLGPRRSATSRTSRGISTSRSATPPPSPPTWCPGSPPESVKVVLSGDGGDELFAGYDKYAVEGRERRYRVLPGFARRVLGDRFAPDARRHAGPQLPAPHRAARRRPLSRRDHAVPERPALGSAHARGRGAGRRRRTPGGPSAPGARAGPAHWLSALQYADLHGYLPLDILTKVDRMSMAHSIGAGAAARSQARRVRGHPAVGPEVSGPDRSTCQRPTWSGGSRRRCHRRNRASSFRSRTGCEGRCARWRASCCSRRARSAAATRPEQVRELWDQHQGGLRSPRQRLWALMALSSGTGRSCDRSRPDGALVA